MRVSEIYNDGVVYGEENGKSYDGDMAKVGKNAEETVISWLKENPQILDVVDTRDVEVLQHADVDCIIKTVDGRHILAEIKSDQHIKDDKNVLFEAIRINHACNSDRAVTLAWTARSPAKWIFYFNPKTKKLYRCLLDDLRKAFQIHTRDKRVNTESRWINTDSTKSTFIFLIPYVNCSLSGKSIFTVYDLSNFS